MNSEITKTLLTLSAGALLTGAIAAHNIRLAKPSADTLQPTIAAPDAEGILKRPAVSARRITDADLEGRNLSLIVKEDFSKMTEGSETEPTSWTVNNSDWSCDDSFFSTPGWSGQGVFSAGGAVALTYPGVGGLLNTPLGVYAGKLIIKFRAKAYKENSYLFLNICKGGLMNPSQAHEGSINLFTFKADEGWKDYMIELTSYQLDEDSYVQFNGISYCKGCLLDDIEIYRDNDFIWTPQNPKAADFMADGFTASWSKVLGTDNYLLSLVEEKITGKGNIVGDVDFNNIGTSTGKLSESDIPEGWDIHLTGEQQTTADGGKDGSPALMLNDGDYIQLPVNGGSFLSLSYFAKPFSKGAGSGYLYIDVLDPASGQWQVWGYMSNDAYPVDGQNIDLKDFEEQYPKTYPFKGLYTGARLRVQGGNSPMIIDNIKFETTPASERRTVFEDKAVDDASYTFTGLDPEAEHYFTVKSKKGETVSAATGLTHAFGISRPVVKEATGIDRRGGFTANWEYTPKADRYKVDVYSVDITESDKPENVMLEEDFSNVHSATGTTAEPEEVGNYYDVTPLDEYVGSTGWEGRGNIIVDGMLGCMEDQTGTFELYSPYMSLQNNGGKYKITMKVASVPGEKFIIQGTSVYAAYDATENGLHEITVELPDGTYHGRLMFYTLNGKPFLIDEIRVTQDLKEGDRLFSKLSDAEETGLEHRFSVDNSSLSLFAYNLLAEHDAFGKTCRSEMSDMAFVQFNSGVSEIEGDGAITSVRSLKGAIEVTLGEAAAIDVFDLTGRKVAALDGMQGANMITVAPGIYVVRAQNCSVKVLVK